MELNTVSLGDFVKLAGIIFEKSKMSLGQEARNSGMFMFNPIPMNSGNTREYTEIDQNEYAKYKGEGDQAARGKVQQGYSKTLTHYRIAEDIGITYEMRSMNKYPEVVRRLTNLAGKGVNRMELDLTHRITFAFSTSYTDMDGRTVDTTLGDALALASTVHKLKGTSTTFRNILANNPQVSKGAIEGMEKLIVEETLNQFGEKVVIPFDIIFTSDDPNTINTVREHLQSTAAVDAVNAGVTNVYKGKYRHVILPRLATDANGAVDTTKRRYWGLASSMYTTGHFDVWEEPRLKIPANLNAGEEFSTDDWNFGVRAGYGICIVNAVWLKISKGDGTA
jgi:hypothetical protein